MRAAALFCFCLFCASEGGAETVVKGSWDAVAALPTGERVELIPFAGDRTKGVFAGADSGSLRLTVKGKEATIPRAEVRVLKIRKARARLTNGAIGAALGAGIGIGLMAALLAATGGSDATREIVAGGAFLGASIGFGAALIPPAYATIYQVKR